MLAPQNGIGACQVPGAAQFDRLQRAAAKTAGDVDHLMGSHRSGDGIGGLAAAFPKQMARGEIVTAHLARRVDNDLRTAIVLNDQRGGPASRFMAWLPP